MNISNSVTAPILLIVMLAVMILFQSVFLHSPDVVVSGESDATDESVSAAEGDTPDNFITYNGVKYYPDKLLLLIIIAYICSILLPSVFYVKLKNIDWFRNLKLTLPSVRLIPFAIYMFFVLILGAVLLNYLFFYIFGETFKFQVIDTGGNAVFSLGVFLSFILVPAACEEFAFRAVLISEYERYGIFCSIAITSAAFAMSKFSLQLFTVYFFASAIFFICAKITESILVPIAMHTGYGFFNIYIEDKLMNVLQLEQNRFIFLFFLFIFFIIFICLSLSTLEELYYRKAYRNDPYPVKVTENTGLIGNFAKTFLSPSFIVAVVVFFIYVSFG